MVSILGIYISSHDILGAMCRNVIDNSTAKWTPGWLNDDPLQVESQVVRGKVLMVGPYINQDSAVKWSPQE